MHFKYTFCITKYIKIHCCTVSQSQRMLPWTRIRLHSISSPMFPPLPSHQQNHLSTHKAGEEKKKSQFVFSLISSLVRELWLPPAQTPQLAPVTGHKPPVGCSLYLYELRVTVKLHTEGGTTKTPGDWKPILENIPFLISTVNHAHLLFFLCKKRAKLPQDAYWIARVKTNLGKTHALFTIGPYQPQIPMVMTSYISACPSRSQGSFLLLSQKSLLDRKQRQCHERTLRSA